METLLSIAIPTFNRSQYAISCIQSLLAIEGNLEVVISDSSSDGKLKELLDGQYGFLLHDSRLRYSFTREKLDMTANLNRALEMCRGYYVTCIGDDDSVVPDILNYLAAFKKVNIDLISPDVVVNYAWPDFSTRFFKRAHKANMYFSFQRPYLKIIRTSDALQCAVRNCFQGTDGLPKLYHGFVARTLLLELRRRTGNYLHGSTPDISAAVGLCYVTKNFVRCNFPLTIPGASGMSNTGRAANNKHVGKLEEEAQTAAISKKSWITGIPKFFSVEVVWAQAGLDTASKFESDVQQRFPFEKLIGICLINHPTLFRECMKAFQELNAKTTKGRWLLLSKTFTAGVKKIAGLIKRLSRPTVSNGRFVVGNSLNIYTAQQRYHSRTKSEKNFNDSDNISLILNQSLLKIDD